MDCSICKGLESALESRLSKYIEARPGAYYRVSTQLAAQTNVDMERAKSALQEHRLVCVSPDKESLEQIADYERLIEYLQKRPLAGKPLER